ncbi:MAG TPA: GNAT family N-acetyltransferase [Gaiellales bacterium]|nr:GNAT family N-acetyltransferase [Gaiellales bacterium]
MALAYPKPELATAGMRLRRWQPSDVDDLVACCNDPDIRRWLPPIPVPYTRGDAEEFIAGARSEDSDLLRFAVELPDVPLAGAIGARETAPGVVQIGYWVSPRARRRGVASGALRLLARWAAGMESVARVQVFMDTENTASMRVAERAGLRHEAVLRSWYDLRGERRDAAMFSLLPGDL